MPKTIAPLPDPVQRNLAFFDPGADETTIQFPAGTLVNGDTFEIVATTPSYDPVTLDGQGNEIEHPAFGVITSGPFIMPSTNVRWIWNSGRGLNGRWWPIIPFLNPMTYHGDWVPGRWYPHRAVVVDSPWTMCANKQTQDKPAPSPIGSPAWISELTGTPTWVTEQVTASSLVVGQRYTFAQAAYVRAVRFWLPGATVGQSAEIWTVDDPLGAPRYTNVVPPFTIENDDVDAWITIRLGADLVPSGYVGDVVLIMRPFVGELSFTYQWDYRRSNQTPGPGEINQPNNDPGVLNVHEQDDTLTDRSTDLDNIVSGSTIETGGVIWSVLNATKVLDVYTFEVTPAVGGVTGLQDVTFKYFGTAPISYVRDVNFYSGTAGVDGFESVTGYDPDGIPLNQNAYGVDVEIQDVEASADWDFVSFAG